MIDIAIALFAVAAHDRTKKERQHRQQQEAGDGGEHAPRTGDGQKPPHRR